jgi:hypothetical protein
MLTLFVAERKKKAGRAPSKTSEDRPLHILSNPNNDKAWSRLGRGRIIDPRHREGGRLFAKMDLPKDLCIPYRGVYVNPQEKETLVRHGNEAEVQCVGEGGEEEWRMMDAHPQLMQDRGIPAGAWPGGYCNQANQSEDLNADLLQHDGKCKVPTYQWMDDRCRNLFVKLRRPVRAGEEILVEYGYSARRQTLWGFGP